MALLENVIKCSPGGNFYFFSNASDILNIDYFFTGPSNNGNITFNILIIYNSIQVTKFINI